MRIEKFKYEIKRKNTKFDMSDLTRKILPYVFIIIDIWKDLRVMFFFFFLRDIV